MHLTSAKAGLDLRCGPGWRRFASSNAPHRKSADASLRKAATPIPIVSSQAFEAAYLQLTLPAIATLANGSRTLSP